MRAIGRMYREDITGIYRSSISFAFACPLLFLIPVAAEFLQHVIEIGLGMYASSEAFGALQWDDDRQITGLIKSLALLLPSYWYVRYLGFGHSKKAATTIEFPAFGLWLIVLAYSILPSFLTVFPNELAAMFGMAKESFSQLTGALMLFLTLLGIYLFGWSVAWPLGNASIGWIGSIKLMHGYFLRAIVYLLCAVIPYMALHYGLTYFAMGASTPLVWSVLIIDSLLVGVLALNMVGAGYFVVSRAAKEKSVMLIRSQSSQ